jgi:hypothetical protein
MFIGQGRERMTICSRIKRDFFSLLGYKFALFINKIILQDFKDWKYQGRLQGVYQERVVRIL